MQEPLDDTTAVVCPNCSTRMRAKRKLAGKKIKCLICQTPVLITVADSGAAQSGPASSASARPISRSPTPTQSAPAAPQSFSEIFEVPCPHCGETLYPTSAHRGFIVCTACRQKVALIDPRTARSSQTDRTKGRQRPAESWHEDSGEIPLAPLSSSAGDELLPALTPLDESPEGEYDELLPPLSPHTSTQSRAPTRGTSGFGSADAQRIKPTQRKRKRHRPDWSIRETLNYVFSGGGQRSFLLLAGIGLLFSVVILILIIKNWQTAANIIEGAFYLVTMVFHGTTFHDTMQATLESGGEDVEVRHAAPFKEAFKSIYVTYFSAIVAIAIVMLIMIAAAFVGALPQELEKHPFILILLVLVFFALFYLFNAMAHLSVAGGKTFWWPISWRVLRSFKAHAGDCLKFLGKLAGGAMFIFLAFIGVTIVIGLILAQLNVPMNGPINGQRIGIYIGIISRPILVAALWIYNARLVGLLGLRILPEYGGD